MRKPPKPALVARRRRAATTPLVVILAMPALLFLVLPILLVIPMSFTAGHVVEFPPSAWGLTAYRELFADEGWRETIMFSLKVSALAVFLSVLTAGLAAIGLPRLRMRGEGLVAAVILIPLAMPVVTLALGIFQFFNQLQINGTLVGIAIAHSVLGVPYVFLTVRAALSKLDLALVRSAMSLGAGTWSVFRWVYLPAILPALLSGALLVFVVSFDEVVIALFISGPGAITFPVKLFTEVQFNLSPAIMAVSTLLLAAVVLSVVVGILLFGVRRTVYRIALGDGGGAGR
ncbi:MAG: ABC transporter permease [Gammaproteobacteria bacterium]|nr:ABC transporter permease [Gammaproteobacteria bacterium]